MDDSWRIVDEKKIMSMSVGGVVEEEEEEERRYKYLAFDLVDAEYHPSRITEIVKMLRTRTMRRGVSNHLASDFTKNDR